MVKINKSEYILSALQRLSAKTLENLLDSRYNKFRKIGVFQEYQKAAEISTTKTHGTLCPKVLQITKNTITFRAAERKSETAKRLFLQTTLPKN